MKYYFILTDGKDAWMQFVYLPTGDDASGYIRDLRSVGISRGNIHTRLRPLEQGNTPRCRAHP